MTTSEVEEIAEELRTLRHELLQASLDCGVVNRRLRVWVHVKLPELIARLEHKERAEWATRTPALLRTLADDSSQETER